MRENPDLPIEYHDSVSELCKGSDALVLMTDWGEFRHLPWLELGKAMKKRNACRR